MQLQLQLRTGLRIQKLHTELLTAAVSICLGTGDTKQRTTSQYTSHESTPLATLFVIPYGGYWFLTCDCMKPASLIGRAVIADKIVSLPCRMECSFP